MIDLVKITPENLAKEHICCALAGAKDGQVRPKKAWLKERLAEGLVFLKGDVRGKCFIEYLPAEFAWAPVEADSYTFIDCLRVAGRIAGQGHPKEEELSLRPHLSAAQGLCRRRHRAPLF